MHVQTKGFEYSWGSVPSELNAFLKTVDVVDIKFVSSHDESTGFVRETALVIYKDEERS